MSSATTAPFYGPDDLIEWPSAWISALQHLASSVILLSYPVLVARAAGFDLERGADFVAMTMLVMCVSTVLQSTGLLEKSGSGFLCFPNPTIIMLPASLAAAQAGGLPLLMGMYVYAGLVIIGLAPLLRRLRPLFPTEISGLIVLLVGISSGLSGMRMVLASDFHPQVILASNPVLASVLVASGSLIVIIVFNIWGRRLLNLSCVLLGCMVGTLAALALQAVSNPFAGHLSFTHVPLPLGFSWSFDPALTIPFGVAALASALKTSGTVLVMQQETTPQWSQADLDNVSAGVFADGVAVLMGGLLGSYPLSTSSASAGLAIATRVHSRRVAWAYCCICLTAAFFPWIARLMFAMPIPVLGAALVFSAAFMMANGLKILTTKPMDSRRTLVVGLSLILGLSVSAVPDMLQAMSTTAQTALGTPIVLGTISALLINLIFRIGVTRRGQYRFTEDIYDAHKASAMIDEVGKLWGARAPVIKRAQFGVTQAIEILRANMGVRGVIACAVSFDDYNVLIRLDWDGPPIVLSQIQPDPEEVLQHPRGDQLLAGYMLAKSADLARVTNRDQHNRLRLKFDH